MITIHFTATPSPSPTQVPVGATSAGKPSTVSSAAAAVPTSAAATSTATTTGTTPGADTGGKSPAEAWIGLAGIIVVALVLAFWNVVLARRKSREEERARQRTAFADALQAAVRYKEMPYAIRRRDKNNLSSERVRISEIVREIQADLSYHQTWIRTESKNVADAYDRLVNETRNVAGTAMRDAWNAPAITHDAQMNIGPDVIDVLSLKTYEDAYTQAVAAHLHKLTPWWCR